MALVKELYQSVRQKVKKSSASPSAVATPAETEATGRATQPAGSRYSEHTPGDAPTLLHSPVSASASKPGIAEVLAELSPLVDAQERAEFQEECYRHRRLLMKDSEQTAHPAANGNAPTLLPSTPVSASASTAAKDQALAELSALVESSEAAEFREEFYRYRRLLGKDSEPSADADAAGTSPSKPPPYTSKSPLPWIKDVFQRVRNSGLDPTSPTDLQVMAETYLDNEGQELVDHEPIKNHSDTIQASRYTGRNSTDAPNLSLLQCSGEVDSGVFGCPGPSDGLGGPGDVKSVTPSQIPSESASTKTSADVAADSTPSVPPKSADRPEYKLSKVRPNVLSARRSSWGIAQSLNTFKTACSTLKDHASRVIHADDETDHAAPDHREMRSPSRSAPLIDTSSAAKGECEEDEDVSPIRPLDDNVNAATPALSQNEHVGNILRGTYRKHYKGPTFAPKLENMDLIMTTDPEDVPLPSSRGSTNQRKPSRSSSVYSDRDAEYTRKLYDELPGLLVVTGAENEDDTQQMATSELQAESEQPKESFPDYFEEKLPAVSDSDDGVKPIRPSDVSTEDDEGASEVERLFNAVSVGWRSEYSPQVSVEAAEAAVIDEPARVHKLPTDHEPQQPSTPCKEAMTSTTAMVQDENSSPQTGTPDSWTTKARKLAKKKSKLWSTWNKAASGKSVKVTTQPVSASGSDEAEAETEFDAVDFIVHGG